ncbi:hypothetical protein KU306_11315 [Haloferax larsenii]|uniref:Uncharacterized protein n=1 Tax=Haloferax larsenii TaxID=302484 RepID=A0ABY5REA6_HALLR|nr:hypothetical protein [Haloferax larsenii]ELZ82125.1 hypothetical protein C455_02909 [Haloferax larsenii JCM 13917]UVE49505.1 hypothetical protein KU306_11315 [Haloferax larsenii]
MDFPRLPSRDTSGQKVVLPDDLDGEQTLLLISFDRRQQSLVGSWRGFAEELSETYDHFEYYELMVLGGRSGMMPSFGGGGGMSPGAARNKRHDNALMARVDKTALQRRLGLLGEGNIYALLIEDGTVVRQAAGVITPKTADALEDLLQEWREANSDWLDATASPEQTGDNALDS